MVPGLLWRNLPLLAGLLWKDQLVLDLHWVGSTICIPAPHRLQERPNLLSFQLKKMQAMTTDFSTFQKHFKRKNCYDFTNTTACLKTSSFHVQAVASLLLLSSHSVGTSTTILHQLGEAGDIEFHSVFLLELLWLRRSKPKEGLEIRIRRGMSEVFFTSEGFKNIARIANAVQCHN